AISECVLALEAGGGAVLANSSPQAERRVGDRRPKRKPPALPNRQTRPRPGQTEAKQKPGSSSPSGRREMPALSTRNLRQPHSRQARLETRSHDDLLNAAGAESPIFLEWSTPNSRTKEWLNSQDFASTTAQEDDIESLVRSTQDVAEPPPPPPPPPPRRRRRRRRRVPPHLQQRHRVVSPPRIPSVLSTLERSAGSAAPADSAFTQAQEPVAVVAIVSVVRTQQVRQERLEFRRNFACLPVSGSTEAAMSRDIMQRSSQPESVKDELIRFCLLSSVRGVPRILRCRSACWKLVWLVSVSGFLGISLVFTVRLVSTYRLYQTVLEVTTEHYSELVPFPSVTVCNLQPFSTDMIRRFGSRTEKNVADIRLLHMLTQLRNDANFSQSFKALTDKSFLYQNWGVDTVRRIGLAFHDFVLNGTCNFTYVKESKLQQRSCNLDSDVLLIPNPQFFTCFMLTPTADIANTTQALEMDLYLDTEQMHSCQDEDLCNDSSTLFDLDDSIGAHVMVHPAGSYPRISQLGIHVLPGTKSVIELVEARSIEKYKHSPKQNCTERRRIQLHIGSGGGGGGGDDRGANSREFEYDSLTCRQLEVQNSIMRHCGCVDPDFPLSSEHSGVPFCGQVGNQSLNFNAFFTSYDCASKQELDPRNLIASDSGVACPASCHSLAFKSTAYQSLWPPKTNELDFYRLRVRNNSMLAGKFSVYSRLDSLVQSGQAAKAADLLQSEEGNLIRDNFLRLRVFRPDFARTVTREKLQITLEALISQIGGSFSLWGGLTVITSVELLEFIYYLFKRLLGCSDGAGDSGEAPPAAAAVTAAATAAGRVQKFDAGGPDQASVARLAFLACDWRLTWSERVARFAFGTLDASGSHLAGQPDGAEQTALAHVAFVAFVALWSGRPRAAQSSGLEFLALRARCFTAQASDTATQMDFKSATWALHTAFYSSILLHLLVHLFYLFIALLHLLYRSIARLHLFYRSIALLHLFYRSISLLHLFYRSIALLHLLYRSIALLHLFYRSIARLHLFYRSISLLHLFYRSIARLHLLYRSIALLHLFYLSLALLHLFYLSLALLHLFYLSLALLHLFYLSIALLHLFYRSIALLHLFYPLLHLFYLSLALLHLFYLSLALLHLFYLSLALLHLFYLSIALLHLIYRCLSLLHLFYLSLALLHLFYLSIALLHLIYRCLSLLHLFYLSLALLHLFYLSIALLHLFYLSIALLHLIYRHQPIEQSCPSHPESADGIQPAAVAVLKTSSPANTASHPQLRTRGAAADPQVKAGIVAQ
uniref:Acid-sensing ion channel 1 n=1 Tax=Macrostomum lignano TaxID=282301 RepID=A0A1I8IN20_9PLAT